jgi:Tripartite tricarboxylate transporter TctB family
MNGVLVVLWIGLGCFLTAYSYRMGLGTFSKPGPGLMPFLIGLLLAGSALCLGYLQIKKKRLEQHSPVGDRAPSEANAVSLKKLSMVIVPLILYGLLLEKAGFIVATFTLLALLFHTLGMNRLSALAASLIAVLGCYFVFTFLGQRFPPGIFRYFGY